MSESIEKKYKVLVVDDELDNLEIFVEEFKRYYNLLSANNANEALKILKEEEDLAVIITDQRMPDVTGVDLLEEVKTKYPFVIRILITGYTDLTVAVDSINKGKVFSYIQKPVEKEPTIEIINDALGQYVENLQIRNAVEDVKKRVKERFIEIYEAVAQGIAHHINNGLVPTKTFYDLLPKKLEAMQHNDYDKTFFEEFLSQASNDLDCVQKIVAMFTWVRNCNVEDFQITKVDELFSINDLEIQKILKDKELELEKNIASDLSDVVVDRMKAQEMVSLLVKNCAKEAPQGTKVKLSAEKNSEGIVVKISRTGESYKPEEIPRLFDPFYKFDKALKDGISGLDLTNCYVIAAKHGSEVKVNSQPDGETSFSVELPISK